MKKGLLITGGIIVAGAIGFLLYRKFGKSSSFSYDELKKALKERQNDDLDIEIASKVYEKAIRNKSITPEEANKQVSILKRIIKEKSEKSLTDDEKKFLNEFRNKLNKFKIEKIALKSTDGKTANFDVYGSKKQVLFDLTKKGLNLQLADKLKDYYLEAEETPNDFTINFKKGNTVYNSWMIDKKTNKISKMFS